MTEGSSEGSLSGVATPLETVRHIREVPDFPKPGISFKDITPLIENGYAFHAAVDGMARATEDATGGTARAMCQLVENAGGIVAGIAVLIELSFLNGLDYLAPYPVTSLIPYDG